MDLRLSRSDHGDRTVVHVAGAVDIGSAGQLRHVFDELLQDGRSTLVADLTEVTFLDSTGLGVLVGRLRLARSVGGWLTIVANEPRVLTVFELTGMDKVFDIHPTLEAALGDDETARSTRPEAVGDATA